MFELQVRNNNGETITLTGQETNYQVAKITGLNPPRAQLNTSPIVGMDGARYNSARLNTRNIVITIKINGDVETNRQYLYLFFPTKMPCRLFFKNEHRDVYIDGYVESFECDIFSNKELAQVSIICLQPYFLDMEETLDDISRVVGLFEFNWFINEDAPIAFSEYQDTGSVDVYNASSGETGLIIEASFAGAVNALEIRNALTGEALTLNYSFITGDLLTINTNKGEKSVSLVRDGDTYNLFSAVEIGSKFLQLEQGDNYFTYEADDGASDANVYIVFRHRTHYRGV